MGNLGNFNSAEVEPQSMNFDPLPAGKYLCHVSESEVKETSKGGEMLKLTFEVDEAAWEGRKIWTNLNIVNDNPKAQQIALGMLSALCRAVGKVGLVSDSAQLHDKLVIVSVGIEAGTVEYPNPKNRVTGFYPAEKKDSNPRKNIKEVVDDAPEAEEELPEFLK